MWTAMSVAEHFRDMGRHVLFLADSVTRFAEAHREIALAAGESAALRGYPPSVAQEIMALAERVGPGDVFRIRVVGQEHGRQWLRRAGEGRGRIAVAAPEIRQTDDGSKIARWLDAVPTRISASSEAGNSSA